MKKLAILLSLALCLTVALISCNDDDWEHVYETDPDGETVTDDDGDPVIATDDEGNKVTVPAGEKESVKNGGADLDTGWGPIIGP